MDPVILMLRRRSKQPQAEIRAEVQIRRAAKRTDDVKNFYRSYRHGKLELLRPPVCFKVTAE